MKVIHGKSGVPARAVVVLLLAGFLIGSSASAAITLNWGTVGTNQWLLQSNGTTPITGNVSSNLGGFVQLIYLGSDNTYDGISAVNDVVVDTGWVGENITMGSVNGRLNDSVIHTNPIGAVYVVRFFDTPSPDYLAGALPGSGNYGLSCLYTNVYDPAGAPATDTFGLTSPYTANQAIPEPATFALMLLGLGAIPMRRRLMKK